jgi:hypothetical protein
MGWTSDENAPGKTLEDFLAKYKNVKRLGRCELPGGRHYARIGRGTPQPHPNETRFSAQWRASVRIGHMLAVRLQEIFRHIEPNEQHRKVFSHELRMLYMLACMEVESACKAVLEANHATPLGRRREFTIDDYKRLARPMRLYEWTVRLSTNPDYGPITPFVEWEPNGAGKLQWYSDHNKVKHSREKDLDLATMENTIEALAGVFVMRVAQFGHVSEPSSLFTRDEFEIFSEPTWDDAERYVVPMTRGPDGKPVAPRWAVRLHEGL